MDDGGALHTFYSVLFFPCSPGNLAACQPPFCHTGVPVLLVRGVSAALGGAPASLWTSRLPSEETE